MSVQERSSILASIRRRLSVVGVRAQANCLLARLGHLNEGAELAAQRRAKVRGVGEAEKREIQANYEAYIRGNLHP